MQTRKQFVKTVGLAGLSILTKQIQTLANGLYSAVAFNNGNVDDVVFYKKADAPYENLRKGFNLRVNNYPAVIALCKNTNGVVAAVQYAKVNNLNIVVKSGGHCMEGFSSLENGMVINVSLLNTLTLNNNNTVTLGPAITLKKIYETLIPNGKYLPGGSCQTVAIGGLTLGGGYGILSRTFGLTCDSLIEATMVTADGEIVNTKNDAQLLWALKGGGNNNMGVITQMKFTIHKAPKTLQSYKFRKTNVTIEEALAICKLWFEQVKKLPNSCFSAFIYNGKTTYILLTNIAVNSNEVNSVINVFKANSNKISQTAALPLGKALKAYYAEDHAITFKNASAGLYKSFANIETVLPNVFEQIKKKPGILYQVNTLGGAIHHKSYANASSFAHRDYLYFSELQAYWDLPSQTLGYIKSFEAIQQQFTQAGITAQYRNYPDINFKDWARLYYGQHLEKLLAIKRKYDATNRFGGLQTLTV
jgi:hypothetical protein